MSAARPLLGLAALLAVVAFASVQAATPCDFKGLAVGDHATPEQIMKYFEVKRYSLSEPPRTDEQRNVERMALLNRAAKVGVTNAGEEADQKRGAYCDDHSCRIPYGQVQVGEEPYPVLVGVFMAFDSKNKITAIDVSYDAGQWDDVLELLNTKYGDNWKPETVPAKSVDYETKKAIPVENTVLTHRNAGVNAKTGDRCTLIAQTPDIIWQHTTAPIIRAELEIKLQSTNF